MMTLIIGKLFSLIEDKKREPKQQGKIFKAVPQPKSIYNS